MFFKPHHVAISVRDLKSSTAFYEKLGFRNALFWRSEQQNLSIVHMKLNDFILELFSYENCGAHPEFAQKLETDLPIIGIKHFALQVKSIEEAKMFFEKRFSVNVEVKKGRTGIDYFFVKDPDGILLEIVEDNRNLNASAHLEIHSKL